MAAKVPIRTVFDGSTATGLAEFQSTEFIALAYGGLGASLSIGSVGQILKVNSAADALEFGAVEAILNIDGMTDGSGITLAASDKFALSDGGTEKYLLASQIDTYVSATSSTLTNKTLTTPIITEIDSGSTITLDATTDIVLDADGGDIFFKDGGTTFGSATNTSGDLILKSGTTTAATFSGANVTLAGNVIVTGNFTVSGTTTTVNKVTVNVEDAFVFEGATADAFETIFSVSDPTADRTIVLPDANGQVQVTPPLTLNGTDGSSTDAGDRLVQNTSANDGDQILYEDATSDVIAVFASHGITLSGLGWNAFQLNNG